MNAHSTHPDNTATLIHMSNTHNTSTITGMIDRLINALDKNMDRLTQDADIIRAIELVYKLQDMRERESEWYRKTHTIV